MKKMMQFFFVVMIAGLSLIGCQKDWSDSVTGPGSPDLGQIIATDSTTGEVLVNTIQNDRAFIAKVILPQGMTNYISISWNFGDSTHSVLDTGKMAVHRYRLSVSQTVHVCARIYTGGPTPTEVCQDFWVNVNPSPTTPYVITLISSVAYGVDQYIMKYGLLKKAIQCDTILAMPFAQGTFNSNPEWVYRNIPRGDTVNGSLILIDTAYNGEVIRMAYGNQIGSGCWATSEPRPGLWQNQFWNGQYNTWKVINGTMQQIGAPLIAPGTVGDPPTGDSSVTRFGLSPNADTLYRYFRKARVSGNQDSAYTVNSLSGINNKIYLKTDPLYPDWWRSGIKISTIPTSSTVVQEHYHGNPTTGNWADIHNSYFYYSISGFLEWQLVFVGGKPAHVINKENMIYQFNWMENNNAGISIRNY